MAKPKLCLIPATQGSKLYSVLPADGVGDFNFSRNTVATRINKDGLIETVASGVSRLNYPLIDGVVNGCPSHLLEPERLQKIQYSEDFSNNWGLIRVTQSANSVISPDGTLNATFLSEDSSNNSHIIIDNNTLSGTYTHSVFAKKGTRVNIGLFCDSSSNVAKFDLDNGVILDSSVFDAEIKEYHNGWYRCVITTTQTTPVRIAILDNSANLSYQGDGTSGLYIWGAQLEAGSYPTSYIPNYGTSAGITRSAETANGAGDASTFNDSEGVLMAEISALANDGTNRQISISNGTNAQRIYFGFSANTNEFILSSRDSSYIQGTISDVLNFNKYAFQYKTGNFKAFINGFNYNLTLDGGLLPTGLDRLNFDDSLGNADFYGNTKQIQYFDSALNDSDLETLTSWTSFTDMANGQTYSIK